MKTFIVSGVHLVAGLLLAAIVTAAGAAEIPEGDYYIVAKHSYKALTAFEGRHGEIVLGQSARKPKDGPAQLWTITRATGETNGATYQIRSRRYGTYLAGGDEDENGNTSVVLKDEQSAEGQAWRFKPHLNSYGIELDDSGTTLNVRANERADDARIIVYDASLDDNAQWLLYPAGNGDRPAAASAAVSEFDNLNKRFRLAPMPAATPEASRLRRTKLMDDQPSGVFVKKGEAVSVTAEGLPPSPDGLTIMIGPMNSFYDERPQDDPQLIIAKEGRTDFTAKRDGLIYFRYAESGFSAALPPIDVAIVRGGSSIPLYVKGKTSFEDWRKMLTDMPGAPFVEMISERVAITATRKVYMRAPQDDPAEILDTLEQILGWYDALSGLDGSSKLHRASRLRMHYQQDTVTPAKVFDDGIYMYAGNYFIGVPGSNMGDLLNVKKLRQAWSIWHETGHMYQQQDWTWGEIVETTVNIYSLNAQAHFGHPFRLKERDDSTGKTPLDLAARYLARKTRDFDNEKQMRVSADDDDELWARLVMFDQLRRGLGEDFYPKLHRYYREHPLDDANEQDAVKIQTFILRASTVANQDLTRFFSDWGLHIEQETADRLKRLNLPPADSQLSRVRLNVASR
ncbi:M60 family metallopeptidase [Mesorhizobium sp. M0306]|uniref:M60 family metallopeptidase n=1 Tax=Mesorhizobium sp. M0306 TaxID=2956932 RepID=UPI003335181F